MYFWIPQCSSMLYYAFLLDYVLLYSIMVFCIGLCSSTLYYDLLYCISYVLVYYVMRNQIMITVAIMQFCSCVFYYGLLNVLYYAFLCWIMVKWIMLMSYTSWHSGLRVMPPLRHRPQNRWGLEEVDYTLVASVKTKSNECRIETHDMQWFYVVNRISKGNF